MYTYTLFCCCVVSPVFNHIRHAYFIGTGATLRSQITRFTWPIWGPPGSCRPRWAPCGPHEPCYLGWSVVEWKHFQRYWPFVRGIHRSPMSSPHKGQWRGVSMFYLICVWTNGWVNNRDASDLRRHRAQYDGTVVTAKFERSIYLVSCVISCVHIHKCYWRNIIIVCGSFIHLKTEITPHEIFDIYQFVVWWSHLVT